MIDEGKIRDMVRRVVRRAVGRTEPSTPVRPWRLVTELDLEGVPRGGRVHLPDGALITPLARQAAMERKISLVVDPAAAPSTPASLTDASAAGRARAVAIGADHGGFRLKETLRPVLAELGYAVIDCGTHSEESVDYPDIALAVAQLVADGRAWRGVLVDGAGIGSAIAANKVPGVRAALCYDEATARNSREHNDANVLTLGAGMVGPSLARAILTTWLQTPAEGGRHARRVAKVMDIERRFLRRA